MKVTVGGGVREGVYHLATFDAGGTFDYAAPGVLFSPDGRTVAFKAFKAGPDGRSQGLWVVALDGSRGRQLDEVGEGENLVLHLLGW
ncbi:MAG: hypothetical protein H5T97_09240, partial [Firmicutes bacterium]|nr:hypothetical protein [Bacillota bacterium]